MLPKYIFIYVNQYVSYFVEVEYIVQSNHVGLDYFLLQILDQNRMISQEKVKVDG